uniref:HDC02049 n=1 Tax=Drosophila melanogaster TaxID=7227 RepID=Q6IHN7_DROME|nr:TPA_inf: HDC02049 [Drosophila melanogaster]
MPQRSTLHAPRPPPSPPNTEIQNQNLNQNQIQMQPLRTSAGIINQRSRPFVANGSGIFTGVAF